MLSQFSQPQESNEAVSEVVLTAPAAEPLHMGVLLVHFQTKRVSASAVLSRTGALDGMLDPARGCAWPDRGSGWHAGPSTRQLVTQHTQMFYSHDCLASLVYREIYRSRTARATQKNPVLRNKGKKIFFLLRQGLTSNSC